MLDRVFYVYTLFMNNENLKWIYRGFLMLVFSGMLYITLLPSYNFAHFIPHTILKSIGVPYQYMLGFENHMDKLLHFAGAFFLLILLYGSKLSNNKQLNLFHYLLLIMGMSFAAEIVQHYRGRGFNYIDLFLGISGGITAYMTILAIKNLK